MIICLKMLVYKSSWYSLNRHIHRLRKRLSRLQHCIDTNVSSRSRSIYTTQSLKNKKKQKIELSEFPPENIRNFSIIAHVDHGKSTLADRFLEYTGVISDTEKNMQGHVDFNFEVSRSLAACQGVILLVDANQGVQAQTVANFYLAFERNLSVIPVLNKIDLPNAQPDVVMQQLYKLFDIKPEEILQVSAKLGIGIKEVLDAIVERIPPPTADKDKPLKCLMFDSWYAPYKGVIANVAVVDGVIRKGDKIMPHQTQKTYEVQEIGIMQATEVPTDILYAGQVGYVTANIKNIKEVLVGETIYHANEPVEPLPGFKPAKPMVYAGVYPIDQSQLALLKVAMDKLTLNDSSVEVHINTSAVLGQGWVLGFLGLLHMDVFITRLDQEFQLSTIVTAPNVPYQVTVKGTKAIKQYGGEIVTVLNPSKLPDVNVILEYREPMVKGTILAPEEYHTQILNLCLSRRGTVPEQSYIDDTRIMSISNLPLNEILVDFFDELKSITSGYASFDYEDIGYQPSDLLKLEFLINGNPVEEMVMLVHRSRARALAERVIGRLKESISRQQFLITLQAKVGQKILSREDIRPYRKDVTAKCYGGDVSRKTKLLKQQAAGKKKMRMIGKVEVPRDAFINALKK
ncbi:translation factor Guf1, mitochondrial-like isoform X2 [Mya arenaria]|uniref:translation factor Guf1, mitochondrial-like isoform X2 n=1 Tax=Mya arenaria TaxID=6604 RepID=UPI0022E0054C|nr:translation factor Guf1, mitochondrial-like isoform X2 [Mya arenaria]